MSLYDTVAHEFQREQWFVGTCKNKEVTHQRLLERGDVGDFVIRISERGGYTLICKIGAEKLSFKHLMQNPDGTIQMEGSKHVLPDMDEMLRLIKPLAKRPSREIVVDDASEDTYLETQDNVADYDFGSRTEDSNAGGYFEVSPIYDDASNYVGIEPEDVEEITEVDPVYDAAGGGEDGVDYDAATAEGKY
eukprot:gene18600-9289_t